MREIASSNMLKLVPSSKSIDFEDTSETATFEIVNMSRHDVAFHLRTSANTKGETVMSGSFHVEPLQGTLAPQQQKTIVVSRTTHQQTSSREEAATQFKHEVILTYKPLLSAGNADDVEDNCTSSVGEPWNRNDEGDDDNSSTTEHVLRLAISTTRNLSKSGHAGAPVDIQTYDDSSGGSRTLNSSTLVLVRIPAVGEKWILTGLASEYDMENFPPALAPYMTEKDFRRAMELINEALIDHWPCVPCWSVGYGCCICTLGLSLYCAWGQIVEAESCTQRQIARLNRRPEFAHAGHHYKIVWSLEKAVWYKCSSWIKIEVHVNNNAVEDRNLKHEVV
jgi:hypothetical protein